MDSSLNSTLNTTYNDYSGPDFVKSPSKICNVSLSEALSGFEKLRISALTKAAEISPLVKEVTIGPKSPLKKDFTREVRQQSPVKHDNISEDILIEDKLKDDLRYTLIMKEYEAQLQERSEIMFRNLVEKVLCKRAETMSNFFKKQSEQCERRAMEVRARKLQLQKELQMNDNLFVLEKAKLDEQKSCTVVNRQTIDNMNKILEEQNKATARFASITDSHTKILICYNEITNLLNTEPLAKQVCDKFIQSINTVVGNISIIMDLCKNAAITDKEVKKAEGLSSNLDNIRKMIVEEIESIKQQELANKQKEEEEKRIRQAQEKAAQDAQAAEIAAAQKAASEQAKKSGPVFYSAKNYAYYKDLSDFLNQYEGQYKGLLEDVKMKKFRFDCQKAVNTPVNALSSVSGLHMKDKYDKLYKLLKGERVQVLDIYVRATEHTQGLAYCTALLAKKIVRQGDLLVSSNPEAAFPLAAVTAALWSQFPEFGILLEANFHRSCPYLVPMLLPQKEGQTDKEFYMSRGYTYSEDGVVEKQDKFLRRMSGIFRLFCAIWIAKMPRFITVPNPHGLQHGWQWLASFVNLRPEPDICATLLHDFFAVCGSEFMKYYGKQFTKIIQLISTDYLTILQNIDEGGPKTRLEVFLQNVLKTGHIDPPSGLLQPNTW
ncbi:hypothetical protein O3G_MSEX010438 [Manduca sexta]|uniref:mRNA export factor GLE1 n=1 Tax=Manduca sexta TaxID=7130 RepID=A0A921ZJA5_MANSE|nr:hypothetical protein O3G_MSEX010438 [Manduca sexta]